MGSRAEERHEALRRGDGMTGQHDERSGRTEGAGGEDDSPYSLAWLGLREPADARARSAELVEALPALLPEGGPTVIRDLGCGSGSMGRWLAGRLPGPQHWVLYDREAGLLDHAREHLPRTAADGSPVSVTARECDLTRLTADDLAGASLVTASALLDLLSLAEVERLVTACVDAGCPALLTLSVLGEVELSPADPLDAEISAAFDAHQRRSSGGQLLLGPDALEATAEAFRRLGAQVRVRPSPWRLGPAEAELTARWLRGWIAAAVEQRPELAAPAAGYLERRLAAATAGELRAVVGHADLLATYG
ncbi:class I SAM-dependent methyltransferase [Micromonospora sp. WMMD1102]|uniref:methyltransferase domain-containing protein n=1 Tax=Micromonospora sp. WMMD1102 TaxID=3016105 RepID=UPI002414F3C4|nr:class I SAM-dependent methyltransferase [Micromonospora sp. WMMD1102]MDG4789339.1 class I SAM-dependent methyltransferase [Micromonospora sp. WMMD1102]